MQTYHRSRVQIEQCGNCRGIFLDCGELENLTRLEAGYAAPPPPGRARRAARRPRLGRARSALRLRPSPQAPRLRQDALLVLITVRRKRQPRTGRRTARRASRPLGPGHATRSRPGVGFDPTSGGRSCGKPLRRGSPTGPARGIGSGS
ncbi:TFIIB-type zinc ribbon-containing protein [Nocardia puris]|uniref:TFIIB-type zinc ribbon-containing protein n=1 Tax=Nocardia puris TaxID=208602 RepID=UPI0018DD49A0|nr:zf-TFIIB domain-containing protein [Nocardia puris]